MLARVLAKQSIIRWLYKKLLHVIIWNFKNVNYITCDSDLVLPRDSLCSPTLRSGTCAVHYVMLCKRERLSVVGTIHVGTQAR